MTSTKKETDMGWANEGPWTYTSLTEPLLTSELTRLSFATSFFDTDSLTFQPCPDPNERNQDRHVVVNWDLPDGSWAFRAIFDGHAGHDTVDYTVRNLPNIIESALTTKINESSGALSPDDVSGVLSHAIRALDDQITQDILGLFPDQDALTALSVDEIRLIINDSDTGGKNSGTVTRGMRGTTVLISLTDPTKSNLWVASLGDCQAILGLHRPGQDWEASILSANHNGTDAGETQRIQAEHPGEPQCVVDNRVLGAIAVTRAVGDHLFKLPRIYTEKVFMNAKPGFRLSTKLEEFITRNLTPPYLSNIPEVRHVDLAATQTTECFLVMCSDGLMDLYEDMDRDLKDLGKLWVQVLQSSTPGEHLALKLLRDALGGTDTERVSRLMTVEMVFRWMDDTTIIVQRLIGSD